MCPSAVAVHRLQKRSKGASGNDLAYILRNYQSIEEAQRMTRRQAGFLKASLDIFLSKNEHLVDNSATLDFASLNPAVSVYYLEGTHFFAKSEFALDQLYKPFSATAGR